MVLLADSTRQPAGFVHHNILVLPDGTVIGVLLGHCIFGPDGTVKAKYFRKTLFSLQGKILAKNTGTGTHPDVDEKKLIEEAWKIISLIKNHSCPVVEPTGDWSGVTLAVHFGEVASVFSS
ncbi:MAG TPA: hypothetical protein VFI06_04760 [Chitinophagaceae bacterium]|nr:hypothetical protein [Chitinophagaceae bacterium]